MRLILLSILLLLALDFFAQDPSFNKANFFCAINPAFAVSPMDFNSVRISYQSAGSYALYGHYNIDKIYTALGAFAEYHENEKQVGAYAAYHTFFLPRNFHLMGGAAIRAHLSDASTEISSRYGLLLSAHPRSNFFAGASYDTGTGSGNSPETFSVQTGAKLLNITRQLVLQGYTVGNLYQRDRYSDIDILVQPTIGNYRWIAGPGYLYDSRNGDRLLLRGSLFYKALFTFVMALPTDNIRSSNPIFDFTIQYKF